MIALFRQWSRLVTKRQEVIDLLSLFKGALTLDHFSVGNPHKNLQALADLEITANERTEILLSLVPEDYVAGPELDDAEPQKQVWVFGKNFEGTEVYIKLEISQDPRKKGVYPATIWSFHPAEFPMRYPLQGGGT